MSEFAYRLLVEKDHIGDEVLTSAALFEALALLSDALHRRHLDQCQASL